MGAGLGDKDEDKDGDEDTDKDKDKDKHGAGPQQPPQPRAGSGATRWRRRCPLLCIPPPLSRLSPPRRHVAALLGQRLVAVRGAAGAPGPPGGRVPLRLRGGGAGLARGVPGPRPAPRRSAGGAEPRAAQRPPRYRRGDGHGGLWGGTWGGSGELAVTPPSLS